MSEEYREEYRVEYREFVKFENQFSVEFIAVVRRRAVSDRAQSYLPHYLLVCLE